MIYGRVRGTVVSTIQHAGLDGRKLLIVDKLDQQGHNTGAYLIAVDATGAGVGEHVLVLDEGNGARQILGENDLPIRSIVVGIVDEVLA
jgi:ethanolamine utilization protein EutN